MMDSWSAGEAGSVLRRGSYFSGAGKVAAWVAALGMATMLMWLAGQPLATPDLWFHLKAGETYLEKGLWPDRDPMLFTAFEGGPVQHEWLFGVGLHLI